MFEQIFDLTFLVGFFSVWLRLSAPIIFASTGLLVAARAGIIDLTAEGVMLIGALGGFLAAFFTGSLWIGVLIGALVGMLASLLTSLMIVGLKMNHSVSGIGMNLFASGITFYLFRVVFSGGGEDIPSVETFDKYAVPILSKIPIVGEIFFSQYILTYIAFIIMIFVWFFLYKTRYGLVIRFSGENPRTIDMKGISINIIQFIALSFSGLMSGLAGAYLPLVTTGLYLNGIAGGRGWIAVTLIIFGHYRPILTLMGALFFGLLEAVQLQIQGLGIRFPHQILLALPYISSIIVLIISGKEAGKPLHLGIPYRRE